MNGTYNSRQDREAVSAGLTIIGVVLLIVIVVAIFALLKGLVLTQLWSWFVVPTFGLPELSPAVAIGIALLVELLTLHDTGSAQNSGDKRIGWTKVAGRFTALLVTLILGYIVHMFV